MPRGSRGSSGLAASKESNRGNRPPGLGPSKLAQVGVEIEMGPWARDGRAFPIQSRRPRTRWEFQASQLDVIEKVLV